ncbi:hypothetical protein Dimus_019265 [Dionaea muscipula]
MGQQQQLAISNQRSAFSMLPLPPPPQWDASASASKPIAPYHQTPASISNSNSISISISSSPTATKRRDAQQRPITLLPQPRRTHPLVWCTAALCLVFSLFLIFFGVATLIIFLVIKPRYPLFDVPNARLNAIYFDSPEYFNGNFNFLANFTNPNKRITLRFDYSDLQLFFRDRLLAVQTINPFIQTRGEMSVGSIEMVSSLVYLPSTLANELQREVQANRIVYLIKGRFKVRAMLGFLHFGYWLKARCQLEMTAPPNGILIARRCNTRR